MASSKGHGQRFFGSLTTFWIKSGIIVPNTLGQLSLHFRFPVPRHGITHPPKPHPSEFPIFLCIHRMINKREVLDVLSHSLTVSLISKHVDISIKKKYPKRHKKKYKIIGGGNSSSTSHFYTFLPYETFCGFAF